MADKISTLIGRGFSWRSVVYRTAKDIRTAGAQGVEIVLSGALGGKGVRKRKQRIAEGYMKKIGEEAKLVDYGAAPAKAKFGTIGVKVRIVKPETRFPDKINIKEILESRKRKPEAEKEEEKTDAKEDAEKKETEKKEDKKEETKAKEKKPAKKEAKENKKEPEKPSFEKKHTAKTEKEKKEDKKEENAETKTEDKKTKDKDSETKEETEKEGKSKETTEEKEEKK